MRIFSALIFLSLITYAQTIDEQIHALDEATPKERVAVMNSIKRQLVSMNEELRMQTISRLREKIQHNNEANHAEGKEPREEAVKNQEQNHANTENFSEIMHHNEAMQMHNELNEEAYHRNRESQRVEREQQIPRGGEHQHRNQQEVGDK